MVVVAVVMTSIEYDDFGDDDVGDEYDKCDDGSSGDDDV